MDEVQALKNVTRNSHDFEFRGNKYQFRRIGQIDNMVITAALTSAQRKLASAGIENEYDGKVLMGTLLVTMELTASLHDDQGKKLFEDYDGLRAKFKLGELLELHEIYKANFKVADEAKKD